MAEAEQIMKRAKIRFEQIYPVQDEVGGEEIEVEVGEGMTIKDIIDELLPEGSSQSRNHIMDEMVIRKDLIVLKNDTDTQRLQGQDTIVCDNDIIRIIPSGET